MTEEGNSIRAIARLAVVTGLLMFPFEVIRNWGNWQPWPGWVIEYICGALLILGGWRALRALPRSVTNFLCAAWGFFLCLLWSSFFGNLEHWSGENFGPIPQKPYTVMIGGFFVYAIVMFIWCMAATRPVGRGS